MAFQGKSDKALVQYSSPEEMYLAAGALPRDPSTAAEGLWLHQGDVIRAYASDRHLATPDLALELPTGSGKTLPGLLVGEWTRRQDKPVIYVAPTTQLAKQVAKTARSEGVPVRVLTGHHDSWSGEPAAAVEGSEAIGVTNYSTVFNSSPKLPVPSMLILDDSHAAAQFVANEYAITINRWREEDAYLTVLAALKPLLSILYVQRLESDPDPGAHHQVRLLFPAVDPDILAKLDGALNSLGDPHGFELAMIRSGLASCAVYLSYGGIQVRPLIPPTHENPVFAGAGQRIYLSATLGHGGELERAFGRAPIVRVPLPTETKPRSGRRLFVFPDLAKTVPGTGTQQQQSDELIRKVVAAKNKALVLSQDTVERAEAAAGALAPGTPVWGKDNVKDGLDAFASSPTGVLGLSNRYDGLDLPGDACRIVVLNGKPSAANLTERFLGDRADAGAALAERLRTRIVQGAGRCTRGPKDYAVVVARGSDLTRWFARPENRHAMDPELQAEVEFGWQNSRGRSHAEILENVTEFLGQTETWRVHGEGKLAEFRAEAQDDPPGAAALGSIVELEIRASQHAATGAWTDASESLQQAARDVGQGSEATRGYRAFLLYMAGVWMAQDTNDQARLARARELVRQARSAAPPTKTTWIQEMPDLPGAEQAELAQADVIAVNSITARLRSPHNPTRIGEGLDGMISDLGQPTAGPYEQGLTTLGKHLGADAFKPTGSGRCDSAWLWGTALWATVEAKSEQHDDGILPLRDIRQANTQLDQLAHDQGMDHPPAGSPAVLVSDRLTADPQHAAVANPNVYLTELEVVSQLAEDARSCWKELLGSAAGIASESVLRSRVADVLTQNGCLPTQVVDRLTQNRIRSVE